jgi:thiamine-phosphate pyrophosphorylase
MPFSLPRFYPILDTAAISARGALVFDVAQALLNTGVAILQYRHKDDWKQQHFDEAAHIAEKCRAANARLVINDRADFAHLLNAAVHIGQDDLPVKAARLVVGPEAVIGRSTHNRQQFVWASEEAADYVALGPIFQTGSKLNPDPLVGIEKLKNMRPLSAKPVVAIGGISLHNVASVLEAGADSVAVISACLPDRCTQHAVSDLAKRWLQACR